VSSEKVPAGSYHKERQFLVRAVEKQPRFCPKKRCTIGSPAEARAKILGVTGSGLCGSLPKQARKLWTQLIQTG